MPQTLEDRLAELEAQVAGRRKEAKEIEESLMRVPKGSGELSFNKEALARQDEARRRRLQAHEQWAQAYEEQLVAVQPEVDQLQAQCRDRADKRDERERRHAAAIAKLVEEDRRDNDEITRLTSPPPMPAPAPSDAVEMVYVGRDMGRDQWMRKDDLDARAQARATDDTLRRQPRRGR